MTLTPWTRRVLIITAGVVVLGLATIGYLSGAEIDLADIFGALGGVVAGLLGGLGIAGGTQQGGGA